MDKRAVSGRGEPVPSILKKSNKHRSGDLVDKSSKIKRENKRGDVNIPLPQGCTPLMYACQQANYKSVIEILNKDPSSVRIRDRGLRCALHYCASSGAGVSQAARAACADRVLMAASHLADARDADGLTPLHLAVVHGNVPLVQTLLAAGADVNAKDNEQHTVVHWATVCGEVGALRAVLVSGADAATPDQHGGYPLHYAAQMCGAPAATDHQGRGAALEVLRALVREGGARVDVRDADGRTPLLWAASAGSAAAVLTLHQAGASVDDADRDGLTALHCAAARGHTEALETLVGLCGARVDVADSHGCTPLHYAAALGHADATSALLVHGADAHRQDRRGRSPAHTAAAKGQIETVRILGARGTNLWLRNSKGDLPLHEAVASGRRELVKWLLDGRPSQVNATNHEGRTPLHIAAATDNADLCRLLMDRGAEVNPVAKSSKNEPLTPLDCAISRGHRATAKYLQMHGGLPATKLSNTEIIIDGSSITALPTRKVTSTKIDVRDRIFIEKREVVELSSPITNRKKVITRSDSDFDKSSSSDERKVKRRTRNKYADIYAKRRKRLSEKQKSFSDGCDSEFEETKKRDHYKHIIVKPKESKSRSKSEPSRKSKSSKSRERYHRSTSESSSESYSARRRSKRHRKRNKRKTTSSSETTASDISRRRSSRHREKKTSIHIENDDRKQSVNIIKYKNIDDSREKDKTVESASAILPSQRTKSEEESTKSQDITKKKTYSETETDTVSVKTNMVITEAQIHMERESSQHGSAEMTVTMDSLNNVSIETSNLSVTHKDKNEDEEKKSEPQVPTEEVTEVDKPIDESIESKEENKVVIESSVEDAKSMHRTTSLDDSKQSETKNNISDKDTQETSEELKTKSPSVDNEIPEKEASLTDKEIKSIDKSQDDSLTNSQKQSFQVLSGPKDSKTEEGALKSSGENESTKKDDGEALPKVSSAVSFSEKDEIIKINDNETIADQSDNTETSNKIIDDEITKTPHEITTVSEEKPELQTEARIGAAELHAAADKGIIKILPDDSTMEDVENENLEPDKFVEYQDSSVTPISPRRISKSLKDSQSSSRKSSIYETESYKVLSETVEADEVSTGILKKSSFIDDENIEGDTLDNTLRRDNSFSRIPSVSDNEIYYSHSEVNGRRKRFRKKGKIKSRLSLRSKSENSERDYESSGFMDSGFEPSPRLVQRRIMSPRLQAYYQQRRSAKLTGKVDSKIPVRKPGDKKAVDMRSVTQRLQTNMRRYYCERKIFQHLLELKRLQIRTSKANEAVLVKRTIDEYNKSSLATVGLGPYNSTDYSFSTFEKFLYESLRKLQKSGKKHLDNLPERPIDFDYGETELYKMTGIPDNPCLCTSKTHRCFHAVHAYTGIPCSAYIPYKWNHHTMPKPATAVSKTRSKGFLPKINSKPPSGKAHVTLEVSHGTERQLIALPAEKLDKNKRYYVTFTVKGSEPPSDNDNSSPKTSKSPKSG
ncbi:hypothetical protein KGM_214584 [Danaus plexippus plexippus]|uniref:Uncharacterized protein n=1 Tax=Danaus plexippus plexippus TaxID=278856 RepID=A0A212F8Y7_DANPL|nr:hypothetical protein KGM_214584 [Danaus plexippus plexippus]